MEENEQLNSDVQTESSSETQSAADSTPAQAGAEQTTNQDNVPFHEHPRFKELIEEKNSYRQQIEDLGRQMKELQASRQQSQTQTQTKDELIERLKGIDPEFGKRFEQMASRDAQFEQLLAWKQQMEAQQTRNQAVDMVQKLHAEYKVPENLRVRYEREIRAMAAENPNLKIQDLPKLYKSVHEEYTKLLDSVRRSDRESYVAGKKADGAAPTPQTKGKPVTPQVRKEFSKDSGVERQETVSEVLKLMRAGRDI